MMPNFTGHTVRPVLILTSVMLMSRCLQGQQETVDELVAKALQAPTDERAVAEAVAALNRNPYRLDTVPSFQELFLKLTGKKPRQFLALALLKAGQKDEIYFEELARYARAAIASDAPESVEYDKEGNSIKDHLNPAFLRWCEDNQLLPQDCKQAVTPHGFDVLLLGQTKDRRAVPILRKALTVANGGIVWAAVQGLAGMNDTASIPLIASSIKRFPPKIAPLIAAAMVDFDDPRVGPLLDHFVTDTKWRQELDESIRKRKTQRQ